MQGWVQISSKKTGTVTTLRLKTFLVIVIVRQIVMYDMRVALIRLRVPNVNFLLGYRWWKKRQKRTQIPLFCKFKGNGFQVGLKFDSM